MATRDTMLTRLAAVLDASTQAGPRGRRAEKSLAAIEQLLAKGEAEEALELAFGDTARVLEVVYRAIREGDPISPAALRTALSRLLRTKSEAVLKRATLTSDGITAHNGPRVAAQRAAGDIAGVLMADRLGAPALDGDGEAKTYKEATVRAYVGRTPGLGAASIDAVEAEVWMAARSWWAAA